jgi:hypothetical protein
LPGIQLKPKPTHLLRAATGHESRILTNERTDLVTTWHFGPRPDTTLPTQWDAVPKSGMFFKGGFGGQILYIAPRKDVVIAHFGTNKTVGDTGPILRLGSMIEELF